ncbi:hypothetical protein [Salinibacterium sp. TMP30]|uniref:hypothetical protein n=1 Tax=Salinibacterium sp. TMP30 TaxID=3138237 RepID=UPI00313A4813
MAGSVLGGLGTVLLTISVEQLLDPATIQDLLVRARVAAFAGVLLLGAGVILAGIAAAVSDARDRWKIVWPAMVMITAPVGVAFSLALSLVIAALVAMAFGTESGWVVGPAGALLVLAGYVLTRELWYKVKARLMEAIRSRCGVAGGIVETDEP